MTLSTNFCQSPTSNLNLNSWVQIRFNGFFQCLFLPHRSPPSSFTVILQNIQPINQKQFVLHGGANKRPVVMESFQILSNRDLVISFVTRFLSACILSPPLQCCHLICLSHSSCPLLPPILCSFLLSCIVKPASLSRNQLKSHR